MTLTASVIIPAHNASDTLPACLHALAKQSASDLLLEVIVVDDGSTDDTAHQARLAGVTLLQQSSRGAAAARNLGARHARGDILLFTDADCEPAPDWVKSMLAPFADADVVGVKGIYCTRQRELTARFVQMEYEDKYRRMARLQEIDFIDTYSAGYRRGIFLRYEGFDETYPKANVEDQEFSFRLAADGHKMLFQPDAVVSHRHAARLKQYLRKKFWIGYWKVKVHIRHPARAVTDSHTPPVLKAQIGLLALSITGLIGGVFWAGGWYLALLSLLLLFGSMLPFVARLWQADVGVALAAPIFLIGRAGALGFGLAAGILAQIARQLGIGRRKVA